MRDRQAQRAHATSQFEDLFEQGFFLQLQSVWIDQIREYVDNYEFEAAFSLLTAEIKKQKPSMSEEDWNRLERMARELSVTDESWNGLQRP